MIGCSSLDEKEIEVIVIDDSDEEISENDELNSLRNMALQSMDRSDSIVSRATRSTLLNAFDEAKRYKVSQEIENGVGLEKDQQNYVGYNSGSLSKPSKRKILPIDYKTKKIKLSENYTVKKCQPLYSMEINVSQNTSLRKVSLNEISNPRSCSSWASNEDQLQVPRKLYGKGKAKRLKFKNLFDLDNLKGLPGFQYKNSVVCLDITSSCSQNSSVGNTAEKNDCSFENEEFTKLKENSSSVTVIDNELNKTNVLPDDTTSNYSQDYFVKSATIKSQSPKYNQEIPNFSPSTLSDNSGRNVSILDEEKSTYSQNLFPDYSTIKSQAPVVISSDKLKDSKPPVNISNKKSKFTIITSHDSLFDNKAGYENVISTLESLIIGFRKSMKDLTESNAKHLNKVKHISVQMENLKNQRTAVNKAIYENRKRICYLNNAMREKSQSLTKYKQLQKQYELRKIETSASITEKKSSISRISSNNNLPKVYINCNHIICPVWIVGNCQNEKCPYQHPNISKAAVPCSNSNNQTNSLETKPVQLNKFSSRGFTMKLSCVACGLKVHFPSSHIIDDWHCRTCCDDLMSMTTATDVLQKLVMIWHHVYKRLLLSVRTSSNARDHTLLEALDICCDALRAKLISVISHLPDDKILSFGRHIIITYNEQQTKSSELLSFISSVGYHPLLVSFATELCFPVPTLHKLLKDTIYYHITKLNTNFLSSYVVDELLQKYCSISHLLSDVSLTECLLEWLRLSIKSNNNCNEVIAILTKRILLEIIGLNDFIPELTYSVGDVDLGEEFWCARKEPITTVIELYRISNTIGSQYSTIEYAPWMDRTVHLLLNKYLIIINFFCGNEEQALEMCHKLSSLNDCFYFTILLCKLSLKYNSPIDITGNVIDRLEFIYNKSEWLLVNRSHNSVINVLETVPKLLYKQHLVLNATPIGHYQHFLGLQISQNADLFQSVQPSADIDSTRIRKMSSIWLSYARLSVLTGNTDNLLQLLTTDNLFQLSSNDLVRVMQLILSCLGNGCYNDYLQRIQSIFLCMIDRMSFKHFIDLFSAVDFTQCNEQLTTWLFFIDYCNKIFPYFSSRFLELVSVRLSSNSNDPIEIADIYRHIIACYPISIERIWFDFIQLLIRMDSPIYELLDVCSMATVRVSSSKRLWSTFYNFALKTNDTKLIASIRERSLKRGFELT